jgi:hypothetical protein
MENETKSKEQEIIEKARKKRLALAMDKSKPIESTDDREDFRKYFLRLGKKLNLDKSLEEVIWKHLKTIGHDKKDKFEDGIKHFGYKI